MKYIFIAFFIILSLTPVSTYLVYFYRRLDSRRKQLLQTILTLSLADEYMLMRYSNKYDQWKEASGGNEAKLIEAFEKDYFNKDFRAGHSHLDFIWPVLLTTLFIILGWLIVFNSLWPFDISNGVADKLFNAAIFGFIGSYLACLVDIFGGYRREDLEPADYYSAAFRILFSTFTASVIGTTLRADFQPVVAFGLGLFPLTKMWEFLIDRASSGLGIGKSEDSLGLDLAKIQGLEHSYTRQKLIDMDICSIQGLATADPLSIFLRTNLPMRTILDMVDKAILYLYIQDDVAKLRKLGVNGVIELVTLARLAEKKPAYKSQEGAEQLPLPSIFEDIEPQELLSQIADAIGQSPEELKAFIYNMYYDPVVTLIYGIWGRYLHRSGEEPGTI